MELRIGLGHDIHRFAENRPLILGGIHIPFDYGLLGHSDADALVHALMDALLGALALGDIGQWFPDSDPSYKDVSSMKLLAAVMTEVRSRGYSVANVDVIVICEKPKIGPFRLQIRESLAAALQVSLDRVSIKAGTNEGCDAIGRGEALTCQAITLLIKDFQ